jgi:hypothetical protein
VQLDPPAAIVEIEKCGLAASSAGVQAAGDAHAHVGLLSGFESFMGGLDLRDGGDAGEGVREGVDARLPQRFELAPAGGEELRALLALDAHTSILVTVS